jgi:hypothetical protein
MVRGRGRETLGVGMKGEGKEKKMSPSLERWRGSEDCG